MNFFKRKKFDTKTLVLSIVALLLVTTNVLTIVWLKHAKQPIKATVESVLADTDQDGLSDSDELSRYQTDPSKTDTDGDGYTDKQEVENNHDPLVNEKVKDSNSVGANELLVDWQQWPVQKDAYFLYDYDSLHKFLVADRGQDWTDNNTNYYSKAFTSYEVGKIKNGKYAGRRLYILGFREPEGPSFGPSYYRVIESSADGQMASSTNKAILLTKLSQEPFDLLKKLFTIDEVTTLANLEPQEQINVPNSDLKLVKTKTEPFLFLGDYADAKKLFRYDGENYIYKSEAKGCFIVAARDGTAREYYYDLPFVTKRADAIEERVDPRNTPLLISLSINGQTATSGEYIMGKIGGCGPMGCYDYPEYVTSQDLLKSVGKFSNGDDIFVLRDNNFSYVDRYKQTVEVLKQQYDIYSPGWDEKKQESKPKIPFEKFVADYPLLFWRDPFGKFVSLTNAKYMSGVECGKPVIYLYPMKTTTVSVHVAPAGGFTVTEPAYGKGWQVEARPDGQLRNLVDNKKYPYLFWEGRALDYQRPDNGFVVAKDEVKDFLTAKLLQLGLNQKESQEFMAYWLPRMQSKAFYFITFVPQAEFERLAPLEVEPKPETVIRVFMDYEGLDRPIKVKEQKIITPVRRGFTVVEWGGALHN